MVTPTRALLDLGLAAQAGALAGKNLELAMKKKKTAGDFLETGITNIAGTGLLKAQAGIIGTF